MENPQRVDKCPMETIVTTESPYLCKFTARPGPPTPTPTAPSQSEEEWPATGRAFANGMINIRRRWTEASQANTQADTYLHHTSINIYKPDAWSDVNSGTQLPGSIPTSWVSFTTSDSLHVHPMRFQWFSSLAPTFMDQKHFNDMAPVWSCGTILSANTWGPWTHKTSWPAGGIRMMPRCLFLSLKFFAHHEVANDADSSVQVTSNDVFNTKKNTNYSNHANTVPTCPRNGERKLSETPSGICTGQAGEQKHLPNLAISTTSNWMSNGSVILSG